MTPVGRRGYPILLMRMVLAWCYFTAGLSKLRISGLAYFGADNLVIQSIDHSLDNLHQTQFRSAFLLPQFHDFMGIAMLIAVTWEILFPLAVFSRKLRWWFLVFGMTFHLSTLFLMNIFFSNLMMMYLVFVDWPALVGWVSQRRFVQKWSIRWGRSGRAPELLPGAERS